jgi:hypothetical protein
MSSFVQRQQPKPHADMDDAPRLTLTVRFLDEPSLWSWAIHDAVSNCVIEDSWTNQWVGYPTRMAALAAGTIRLEELRGPATCERRSS